MDAHHDQRRYTVEIQFNSPIKIVALFALLFFLNWQCAVAQKNGNRNRSSITIPDTPAGKQLGVWLKAFNSGRREAMRRFIEENFEKPPEGVLPADEMAERDAAGFRETGGYLVRKIVSSAPSNITILVEAKLTGYWRKIQFYVKTEPPDNAPVPPYKIVGIGFSNVEAPTDLLPKTKLTERQIVLKTGELLTKLAALDRFSGAVLISKDERVLYQKAFGLANRTWQIKNRPDTKFNLASVTKMFTAIAVAQLIEQGKINLDEPIGEILAGYPNKAVAEQITIHQLLNHTSGLGSADRTAEKLLATLRNGARTINEHLAVFADDPLSFEPGSRFDYSNYGYILLGAIIEKVSGQDYYTYVRENIFKPTGMTNTDFYETDSDTPNLAEGLMDAPNGTRLNNVLFIGVKGMPAGGAYSTIGDLLKFSVALRNRKLIGAKTLSLLWTGSPQNKRYGGGFEISRYNKTRIVGHGGGWFGITNRMDIYPDSGYTVVILSNIDSDPTSIANKLREWITQNPLNEIPVSPDFKISVRTSPEIVASGSTVKITVEVKNTGGEAEEKIIDLEIKDASGAKIEQQFTPGESIGTGETKNFNYLWTPKQQGVFTIDVGVFGDNWATKHIFKNGAGNITVK